MSHIVKKIITLTEGDSEKIINNEMLFDIRGTYRSELRHFINVVKDNIKVRTSLDDGINALKLLDDSHV